MNFLDSIQRREVIDEDKKISKRALDSEFAFIKRIGEDSLPPTQMDKRVLFNINKYIEEIARTAEAMFDKLNSLLPPTGSPEDQNHQLLGDFKIEPDKLVNYWNEMVNYINIFQNTNKLSIKERNMLFDLLQERALGILSSVTDVFSYATGFSDNAGNPVYEDDKFVNESTEQTFKDYSTVYDRLVNNNLSVINFDKYKIEKPAMKGEPITNIPIRQDVAQGVAIGRPSREESRRQEEARQLAQSRDLAERGFEDLARELYPAWVEIATSDLEDEERREAEDGVIAEADTLLRERYGLNIPYDALRTIFETQPELYYEAQGEGKPKRKSKSKKKMGDDELQLEIEFKTKKGEEYNDKKMKKAEKKKSSMLYDDSRDSNYFK